MKRMGTKGSKFGAGKGAREEVLPSRFAMQTLTKGDAGKRTMNNYAKETPGVGNGSPSVLDMDRDGV